MQVDDYKIQHLVPLSRGSFIMPILLWLRAYFHVISFNTLPPHFPIESFSQQARGNGAYSKSDFHGIKWIMLIFIYISATHITGNVYKKNNPKGNVKLQVIFTHKWLNFMLLNTIAMYKSIISQKFSSSPILKEETIPSICVLR